MRRVDHLRGTTFHGRRGGVRNAFRYSVDYVMADAEAETTGPRLFSRNRANLMALYDSDHGGPPGRGTGAAWLRACLEARGLASHAHRIEILTQPRVLGHVFNPVSFWFVRDRDEGLRAVLAEVTNTFGDRHSYLCHRADLAPITADDRLSAHKILHVSPFQDVAGTYRFRFDIGAGAVDIRIEYGAGPEGLIATLSGACRPLTDGAILGACLRRPFGSRRVLALIHWQALKLWWKGARYRPRPHPPDRDISTGERPPHLEQRRG